MLNIHPNEGVVLLGIVQIILGLSLIVMTFFERKYHEVRGSFNRVQKSLLAIAAVTLVMVFFVVNYYLSLPETELSSKEILRSMIFMMGVVALIYTYAIENTNLDKRIKRMSLYTYLTGKKISYFHVCLVVVGIVFIFLGYESIFI